MDKIAFIKLNQITALADYIRFKLLLALFNSDCIIGGEKIGTHSHTFEELKMIVSVQSADLNYHLGILKDLNLVKKGEDEEYYHITQEGKEILSEFEINSDLVAKIGNSINRQ